MSSRARLAWRVLGPCLCLLSACARVQGASGGDDVIGAAAPSVGPTIGPTPGPQPEPPQRENPYRDDSDAAHAGRSAFVSFNCYGCHGGHGGGGMGPSLRDRDWIYGASSALIFDAIARGRANGMPAWGARLPERTIWQLVTYIQTLSTDGEVDPPR